MRHTGTIMNMSMNIITGNTTIIIMKKATAA